MPENIKAKTVKIKDDAFIEGWDVDWLIEYRGQVVEVDERYTREGFHRVNVLLAAPDGSTMSISMNESEVEDG